MSFPDLANRTGALKDYNSLSIALSKTGELDQQGIPYINFGGGYPPGDILRNTIGPAILESTIFLHQQKPDLVATLLNYMGPEGYWGLKESITNILNPEIDKSISADQIFFSNGLQDSLDLTGRILLDPGDVILTEIPTYPGALQAFSIQDGVEVWGIPTDQDGMIPDGVTDAIKIAKKEGRKIKMAYLQVGGNPNSSQILTKERGEELLEQSQKYGFAIYQDDAYNHLIYDDTIPSPPLIKYSDYTIFGRTFSKTISPGIRLAWTVFPKHMMPAVLGFKGRSALTTSPYIQGIISEFINSGKFQESLPTIKKVYKEKAQAMERAIKSSRNLSAYPIRTSMFAWTKNKFGIDTQAIADRMLKEFQVIILPGYDCIPRRIIGDQNIIEDTKSMMRINFTSPPNNEVINKGISYLDDGFETIMKEVTPSTISL